MAHNSLRRELSRVIADYDVTPIRDYKPILERCLGALGGPVQDNRPTVTISEGGTPIDTVAPTLAPFAPIDTVAVQEPVSVVDSETYSTESEVAIGE